MDNTETLYLQMQTALKAWVDLSETEWEALKGIFRVRSAEARDFVALPGDEQHALIFVCNGLLRFYYTDRDGKETNKAFIAENTFAGAMASAAL